MLKGLFPVLAILLFAHPAFALHPLITDNADPVEPGHAEIELNASYATDKDSWGGTTIERSGTDGELRVTTGIVKHLDVSIAIPYLFLEREKEDGQLTAKNEGFGDMTAEFKYLILEQGGYKIAIKPGLIMPTGKSSAGLSDGKWGLSGFLIITREFSDGKYALHYNAGYERHNYRSLVLKDANRPDLWKTTLAGEAEILPHLKALGEVGLATTQDRVTSQLSAFTIMGAAYELNDHLEVNGGIKVGLTKPETDFSALWGVTLKF